MKKFMLLSILAVTFSSLSFAQIASKQLNANINILVEIEGNDIASLEEDLLFELKRNHFKPINSNEFNNKIKLNSTYKLVIRYNYKGRGPNFLITKLDARLIDSKNNIIRIKHMPKDRTTINTASFITRYLNKELRNINS